MHRALSPLLIGRETELGELEDTLLAASRGDAAVVLVAGEAGMGKTRMADELIARARKIGFEVLTGACSEAELSLPYLPFVEAVGNYLARTDLEPLRERLGSSSRELGRLFPRLAGSEAQVDAGDPAYARLRLCEALADLLRVPAEKRGLLLVLEDLHWADASTREVLDFLVRRLRTGRVMVLGTYRSDEMHRKHPLLPTVQGWRRADLVEVVALEPLSADAVAGMVSAIFDVESVTDEFRDFLHARCEGNPFVLEEMLKLAIERGDMYRTEKGWERKALTELRLPRTVKDTILMRVERLAEPQIQLLGTAAVLGQSFESSLLMAASGQSAEAVEDALHAAEQQQILEEEPAAGRYRFRHALTREVIYEDLPAPKRERLHLRAAEALRERSAFAPVDVVWHLMAANAFAEALPLCLEAAREASRIGAYEEAADLFRRALPHIVEPKARAEVLCQLGMACSRTGEIGSAVDYLHEGIDLMQNLGDPISAARYRIDLGRAYGLRGQSDLERGEYETAARHLEPDGPSEALALTYMRLAALRCFDYEYEQALPMAERAYRVAEAAGAEMIRIWTYNFIGLAYLGQGRLDEGYESLRRSYREARQNDLRWIAGNALHNLSAMLTWGGEPRARESLALVPQLRELNVGIWSTTSPLLAEEMTNYFLGYFELGVAAGVKAVELGSAGGNAWVVRFAEITLSLLYTELGRLDAAKPLLGISHVERQKDSQEAAAIIRFSLSIGDVGRALEAARFLLKSEETAREIAFASELAVQAFVTAGELDDARSMVKAIGLQPWLEKTPSVLRARARVALAEGQAEAAGQLAQAALDSFAAAGYRPDAARTLILLAQVAIVSDDTQPAIAHLRSAARIADEVGSVAIRREAQAVMTEVGAELDEPVAPTVAPEPEPAPGERLVTVLFADVRGYTALAGSVAPADLADRISTLQRWAVIEVERHHGVLDKFAGDAMMATFNVSGASVDHCLHALQTAFAIRDKAAILGLPVGVGIATGSAVVGRMARGANLSVLGEATNLASRLQGQAAAGEMLLSDESHRRVHEWLAERGLAIEPVGLTLKGIEGETRAFRLHAPVEVATA
jgi:class 3 adenylate cyclase/tetratricopeptide (TPR) repeat protein